MATIRFGFRRLNFHLLRRSFLLLKLTAFVIAVLLFCEFLIYYLVIVWCNWPEIKTPAHDSERERYDALSREASQKLLWWLRPRLVLSGHTHSACEVLHGAGIPELSVPSFSWRNRNNPSFIMGSMTPMDYALAKCYLPCEDTVLITYCGAAGFLVVRILVHFGLLASPSPFGWKLLRKFKTSWWSSGSKALTGGMAQKH
uniref:Metallophosphoesterase 1 n=1 Tax=Molossus molossus TaxID=27622 RepID=A0A7J8HJI2_MOLMO|nr:metallophosphoesterase 1 [Molossus molossus]